MVSGIAAQLTATKGCEARGELRWMKRASTSLPVPDSPTMSTVHSVAATRCASSSRRRELAAQATGSASGRPALSAAGLGSIEFSLISCLPRTHERGQRENCKSRAWERRVKRAAGHNGGRRLPPGASIFRQALRRADAELAQLLDQRRASQVEEPCSMRDRAVGAGQRLLDERPLDRREIGAQVEPT